MPSARLLSNSTLLTPGGWLPAAWLTKGTLVCGADRHGQLVERPVQLALSAEKRRSAFLGSHTSFGYFCDATRLLDSTGKHHMPCDIINGMTINTVRFESTLDITCPNASEVATTALWTDMADGAAVSRSKLILIRCHGALTHDAQLSEFHRFGQYHYRLIRRNRFEEVFRASWLETMAALILECLTGEDGVVRIERKHHLLGLWIASALWKLGRNKRVLYDSLQHTSTLSFSDSASLTRPVEPGACAFLGATDLQNVDLSWDDAHWNPVVSGFFVAASQSS